MPCPLPARMVPFALALLFGLAVRPAAAQEEPEPPTPADSAGADSLAAAADTTEVAPRIAEDPRLTWLGDTLPPVDTLAFTEPIEIIPDSLVDPYVVQRPGARPVFEIGGDALLGRGAFSLLDVIESESLLLGMDLGGGGLPTFLAWPTGDPTAVQVVIDGVPAGNPLAAQWDLRQVPLEGIARVAFHPGPQVSAWGGGGSGGVLSITTRRAVARAARSLLGFSVGSFDVETFAGNFGRGLGRDGSVFAAANFDATEGLENAGDFTRNQLIAKGSWRVAGRHLIEVTRRSDDLSGEAGRATVTGEEDVEAKSWHGFYRGGLGPLGFRAHGWRENQRIDQAFLFRGQEGLVGEGQRRGWSAEAELGLGGWIVWGTGASEEEELSSSHVAFLTGGLNLLDPPEAFTGTSVETPRERSEWGGGIGYGDPGGRWGANATVRRLDYGERIDAANAWQIELAARPGHGLELQALAGRAPRRADPVGEAVLARRADEALEIHPGRIADPTALATWTGWRASVAWSDPDWRISAAAFGGTGDDVPVWLPSTAWLSFDPGDSDAFPLGRDGFNAFDVLDLTASGAEVELRMPLPWGFQGRLAARRLSLTDDRIDEQLPYVPEDQALGQLRYARRFFPSRDLLVEARLAGRYAGERATLTADPLRSYLATDALLQATVINFTIFVSVKNLADVRYRTEDALDLPGAEGYLGIVWRFRG